MDNLMLRRRLLMAAQGVWTTITATTPFSVQNALKSKMRSLIQYGKMVQDGTPTPDALVYPTINNGTVQMVHRSGLPSDYKLLEYVGSSGAAYVVTDVFLASTDVVEAEFRNNSTNGYGALYGVFRLGDSSALYANQTYYGYDENNNKVDTDIRVNTGWHSSRHDFVNGTLTIDDTTVNFTPWEFVNTTQNAVLARYYNGSYGYIWKGYIRKFKVTRGGEVICDLLPAKNEQDEAGLYDLISGNFYTATSGTLVAGDEVNDYDPAVVGDPEVLTVGTQTATVPDLFAVGDYADEVDLVAGTKTRRVGMLVLDGTESGWTQASTSTGVLRFFLPFDGAATPTGARLQVASTHFAYAGDGQDIGITFLSTGKRVFFIPSDQTMTVATWKAWLADQYAAGTPVIVWYPLATPTIESITSQAFSTVKGVNVIDATSDIAPFDVSVTYRARK